MSAPSPPPDNSLAVEAMKEENARQAQADQDAKDAAHKLELSGMRTSARNAATGSAEDYFSSQGVDPTPYEGQIASRLNDILGGISSTDENPAAAFTGAGQTIFDALTTAGQGKATRSVNAMFSPNYGETRATMNLEDAPIATYENQQYSDADAIIKNMLDRGVLTSSGYNAAKADLDSQRAGVHSKLQGIGQDLITKEQGDLNAIANKARQTAGNLGLGQAFDVNTYGTEADTSFKNFLDSLGSNIQAAAPGKLFNTAGLAAIGGAGQGAGNTAYDPNAAAGIIDDSTGADTSNKTNPNSIF